MIDLLRRIVVLGRHMTGIILEFDMLLAMVLVMDVLLVCMVVVRHLVMLWERMIRLLYAVHLPAQAQKVDLQSTTIAHRYAAVLARKPVPLVNCSLKETA